jgi:phosphohistidine phosphatase
MGRELAGLGAKPDVIVSSPAVRAITTARLAAEELSFPADKIVEEPLIYEAGLSDLLSVVSRVGGSFKEALLCGHNPGLTYLAEELSGQPVGSIPTCGVFSMDFNAASWDGITPGSGRVRFFIFPKAFED